MGTLAYMPPEQARGEIDQLDEQCDVFGIGAILGVILTGKPPNYSKVREQIFSLACKGDLTEPFARLDACGADLEVIDLCKRCMASVKEDRPRDAGEVADAVSAYQVGVQEKLRQAELAKAQAEVQAAEGRKRHHVERQKRRWTIAAAVAMGLLLFGGGLFFWWQDRLAAWQDRQADRNGEAVAGLIKQCEDALRAGNESIAGQTLEQAEHRASQGGVDHLKKRFAQCRADLEILLTLPFSKYLRKSFPGHWPNILAKNT